MNGQLEVLNAGPALSIQDPGRPGHARFGLSAGGAMDPWALAEGEALLANPPGSAALEMAGYGGRFGARDQGFWCALTGAAMQARLDGEPLAWRRSFRLEPGQVLEVGAAIADRTDGGTWGYLHVAGGIDTPREIGARGTHLRAGLGGIDGTLLQSGVRLPVGDVSRAPSVPLALPDPAYLGRRRVRILWGPQSARFSDHTRQRLLTETFRLSHRRDRMAMRLDIGEADPFEALLTGLSDPTMIGDIQVTGDGVPAILMREHQPTGGYPRIATVISADLCTTAQLPVGAAFRFELVTRDEAVDALRRWRHDLTRLQKLVSPLVRSVDQVDNLLDYNLIGGVVSARDDMGNT